MLACSNLSGLEKGQFLPQPIEKSQTVCLLAGNFKRVVHPQTFP